MQLVCEYQIYFFLRINSILKMFMAQIADSWVFQLILTCVVFTNKDTAHNIYCMAFQGKIHFCRVKKKLLKSKWLKDVLLIRNVANILYSLWVWIPYLMTQSRLSWMHSLCPTAGTRSFSQRCDNRATAHPAPVVLELADRVEDGIEGWVGQCERYHPEEHCRWDMRVAQKVSCQDEEGDDENRAPHD